MLMVPLGIQIIWGSSDGFQKNNQKDKD